MATFPNFPRRAFLNLVSLFAGGALLPARLQAVGQGATAPTSVIIDTDPGQDDAIAILFALGARGRLDVRALTAVAGNVPLGLTERNARIIRDWAGRTHELPVYAGCPRPLTRELITAAHVHGKTGLEGVELPVPLAPLAPQHAVSYLVGALADAAPNSVTLCALGPLTNLASALIAAPQIRFALREIVLMGGAFFERGNITPAAEFNIYVDPQAAEIVFGSGVPIVVLPRDVAVKAPITPARVAPFRALGNRCGTIVADIMAAEIAYQKKRRGVEQAPMYDPTAVGYLFDPSMFSGRKVNVVVETSGQWTLGETVVDWDGRSGRAPNAMWINDVDADRFYAALLDSVAKLP
ncbi:nucleoside hydrolase [Ralstonia syzygii subsp. celebesensis]|uniref:Nucleoside hydrolase n=3 Tax=Ralstonia solanacearum species complex TaxID=3116862 RepID=A0AAD0S5J2_RALSL|nr:MULTISPECIES: nucleoside hydrolase [Ralstonia solanacearum species complex]CCA79680.1 putative ribonucleoside hydrolase [blood disease bacterium R229]AQW29337.1 nucleoside hydrolase [blood disease bacterium A2-HR MARDI]AXV80775.1 nucleoside hydrolase [Ralstonia solanacearum]AXW51923.1 nucleoside hydrolase [Ralstonia solanacearum]QQV56787.1 nucleoside hydrolase [Ralstonia syzygii subsp. celebesensis]